MKPIIGPGLEVLFVGINPPLESGATGHHFARPGNRFWPTLHRAGFTPRQLRPSEDRVYPGGMSVLLLVVALLVLAGCGDSEREASQTQPSTELTVTVAGKTRTVTDANGLTPADFEPVPATQACTQIFGGDATATVRGTLNGEPVDAEFSLTDGCEIARWEHASSLLGDPPRG